MSWNWTDGTELYHHGILGQKWGKRNGPPYPLDYESHSSKEKKLNSKSKIDGESDSELSKKKGLTDKQKKILIGAGATIALGVAAYGLYKGYKISDFSNDKIISGKDFVQNQISGGFNLGMIKSVNSNNRGTPEGMINCTHCCLSYILNKYFGFKSTAKGFSGVDEVSGMVANGRDVNIYKTIFNNLDYKELGSPLLKFSDSLSQIKRGTYGIICVHNMFGSHVVNYRKTIFGTFLADTQSGDIYYGPLSKILNTRYSGFITAIDFSKAELKDNVENILNLMIEY